MPSSSSSFLLYHPMKEAASLSICVYVCPIWPTVSPYIHLSITPHPFGQLSVLPSVCPSVRTLARSRACVTQCISRAANNHRRKRAAFRAAGRGKREYRPAWFVTSSPAGCSPNTQSGGLLGAGHRLTTGVESPLQRAATAALGDVR